MRKTKIICTLGPATDQAGVLEQLMEEGMNVARFNFSHGDYEEHKGRMDLLKKVRKSRNKPVAMLLDTKGPEIRTGVFEHGNIQVIKGQRFTLTNRTVIGNEQIVQITYQELAKDVSEKTRILIDDGLVELEVSSIQEGDIICVVKNDGTIGNHKGINVPGVQVNMPYLSNKDREDICFGIEQDVDFIAASFVRCGSDVKEIRALLDEHGGEAINIIAKIENSQGVTNIDEIIKQADGIMIARGDMGVELPGEEVPIVQKMIIKKVYEAGKQVITATQMLESMIKHPRPTRAETTDIANAIYDGTSAIMLSGETAIGAYPVEALKTMVRIANRTEGDIDYKKRFFQRARNEDPDITDAIGHATCTTAYDLNATAILTVSKSGRTARMISKYRPGCDIIGCTIDEKVNRQINLSWGVRPLLLKEKKDVFELFAHAVEISKQQGLVKDGDVTVITSGIPIGKSGTTNMLKVQIV